VESPVIIFMLHEWYLRLSRGRRWFSRDEWIARVLGPADEGFSGAEPGLVLVQIDGLSRRELERALERGRMPFLRRLLQRERYRLHDFYSGLPATTFAVQSELFYGLRTAVPAVGFRLRHSGEVDMILDPPDAERREAEIAAHNGPPLLAGGSAYGDALKGGAAEPHFCAPTLTLRAMLSGVRWRLLPLLLVLYFPTVLRILWDAFLALFEATAEAWKGYQQGYSFWHEFAFIRNRVAVDIVLREWQTYKAKIDALRGLPIIHVNYLGYDEKAHRRGPKSAFAHRSLRSVDRSIRRIWNAAARSSHRDYEVWVYGDHGQEQTAPYPHKFDCELGEAVRPIIERFVPPLSEDEPAFEIAAIGPVGYIYPREPLTPRQAAEAAEALVREAHVPTVLYKNEQGRMAFCNGAGRAGVLPEQTAQAVGSDHPFLNELNEDLLAMCQHPEAGQLVLLGWLPGEEPISFVLENGGHGGPGLAETRAFAALPVNVPPPKTGYFRPLDLRAAALRRLGQPADSAAPEPAASAPVAAKTNQALLIHASTTTAVRVATYNVHSCIGLDGKMSPHRIARVLAQCDADIIALQELDVRRQRTQGRDQVAEIAQELNMAYQFFPAIRRADEQYGDAILSRLPMRLVRSGLLPGVAASRRGEPRGVVWVEVTVGSRRLQVLNTHLGLNDQEQQEQVAALLGPEWLTHPDCREPFLLCGDLNLGPRSKTYRLLAACLQDVQLHNGHRPQATCPSPLPLARIDHIFFKGPLHVQTAAPVKTRLTRQASDHLPLVAELKLT
jgi:endonuclease/exonuclease/phosphatase family metal-dependent hydrolase